MSSGHRSIRSVPFRLLCDRAKKWGKGDYHNSPKMEFVSITIQLTFTIEIGDE